MPAERAKNIVLWIFKPFFARDRHYWKVVLLCLAAAATFWFLNALNKTYTNVRTTYPLEFVYNKEKLIPLNPLPEEIMINVSGKGWKLLRKYLKLDVRPAEIVLLSTPRNDYLLGSELRADVAAVLDGLQLNFIFTDTIYFKFDRLIERKIPLAVDSSSIQTTPNVALTSRIQINPDSVLFKGPASIVDSLPSPFPVELPQNIVDRSFKRFIPIEYPNKSLVTASVTDVEVSFAISPIAWQELPVVPFIQNLPEGREATVEPGTVVIRYGQQANGQVAVTPDQFTVVADFATYNPADSTAEVKLIRQPASVQKATLQPGKVKIRFLP